MKNKSADFVLDVLVSLTRDKVRHWEYCIDVHKKLEPHDELGLARMEGIYIAYMNTLNMLESNKRVSNTLFLHSHALAPLAYLLRNSLILLIIENQLSNFMKNLTINFQRSYRKAEKLLVHPHA